MTLAQPFVTPLLAGALALAGLAGCAMDTESDVRAQIDTWVDIGNTLEFASQMSCTAGVFQLASSEVKSNAPHAVTIREGLSLIRQRGVASFQTPSLSPTDISAQINSMDMAVGNAVLAAGLAPRSCLSDDWKAAYLAALQTKGAVLIYSRKDKALVVIDQASRQVFFGKGDA